MPTTTEEFFADLSRRGHDPLLRRTAGSIRFDFHTAGGPERWLVEIDQGDIAVSRRTRKADCLVQADLAAFDQIIGGTDNAIAALLRGAIYAEGDYQLLALFQRLFPSPAGSARLTTGG
jgi:putative sterol carrier protein